jgi:hypothetical protein
MLPVIELASGRIPCEPSCTCDRDARIAKGIEQLDIDAYNQGQDDQSHYLWGGGSRERKASEADRIAAFAEASR